MKYVKYPRTFHLPYSNADSDDKVLLSDEMFIGKQVVVTLKMDGENTTMYDDFIHSRSLTNSNHFTRDYVKGIWAKIKHLLDSNMRLCGENMYAIHTIEYDNLESYFLLFSIWIDDLCLSWKETMEYAKILGLSTVPVIYEGVYDKKLILNTFKQYESTNEGFIIRLSDSFTDFSNSVAKYVKPSFKVKDWQEFKTNKLK